MEEEQRGRSEPAEGKNVHLKKRRVFFQYTHACTETLMSKRTEVVQFVWACFPIKWAHRSFFCFFFLYMNANWTRLKCWNYVSESHHSHIVTSTTPCVCPHKRAKSIPSLKLHWIFQLNVFVSNCHFTLAPKWDSFFPPKVTVCVYRAHTSHVLTTRWKASPSLSTKGAAAKSTQSEVDRLLHPILFHFHHFPCFCFPSWN